MDSVTLDREVSTLVEGGGLSNNQERYLDQRAHKVLYTLYTKGNKYRWDLFLKKMKSFEPSVKNSALLTTLLKTAITIKDGVAQKKTCWASINFNHT